MLGEPLIFESHDRSHGSYFKVTRLVERRSSEYQEILVFDTERHGRVMFVDGQMMFTSTTPGPYNESMALIPLHLHPEPKRVLIVGGGDGLVLKHALAYRGVEAVTLAELDGEVVAMTRKHFPELRAPFEDPRVTMLIGDGAEYVRETEDRFDVCIIDSTDPYFESDPDAVATPLAQPEFYRGLRRVLGERGIGIQILGHHYFSPLVLRMLVKRLKTLWESVELALVPVPFYISGSWSLGVFSRGPLAVLEPRGCEIEGLQYYNADVHRAAFAHPEDVRRLLEGIDAEVSGDASGSGMHEQA